MLPSVARSIDGVDRCRPLTNAAATSGELMRFPGPPAPGWLAALLATVRLAWRGCRSTVCIDGDAAQLPTVEDLSPV